MSAFISVLRYLTYPSYQSALEGSTVIVSCFSVADEVFWLKDNGFLLDNVIAMPTDNNTNNHQLIIVNIHPDNQGTYLCREQDVLFGPNVFFTSESYIEVLGKI